MVTVPRLPECARLARCYDETRTIRCREADLGLIFSLYSATEIMPQPFRIPKLGKYDSWLRVVVVLVLLGIGLYSAWQREQQQPPAEQPSSDGQLDKPFELPQIVLNPHVRQQHPEQEPPPTSESPATGRTVIAGQTIRDQDGKTVFRGDVDVGTTLARIHRNERLRFSHDGIVFQNRERRLPQKPAGYYHEFVHPTPGIGGPGPQRIVMGREGETYYTPDHYRSFRRLD